MVDTTPRRTVEALARMRELRAEGATLKQVAAALGTSYNTVRKALANGVAKECQPPVDEAAVRRLHAQGLSYAAIARQLGRSETAVGRICRKIEAEAKAARVKPRVAAPVARREGGTSPVAPAALAPHSPRVFPARMVASLVMNGMRPEVAAVTARAWADRHARSIGQGGR